MLILIWILGKAIRSVPNLYKESKEGGGLRTLVYLIFLLGLRLGFVFVLVALVVSVWAFPRILGPLFDIECCIVIALIIGGFCVLFVLIGTFVIAKQRMFKDVDVLDDVMDL